MQKINTNPTLQRYIVGGAFLQAFIIIIAVAFFLAHDVMIKKQNTDAYTNATKIELTTSSNSGSIYIPKFYFNVNDNQYVCNTGFSSSVKPSSDNKVYYNSQNPEICVSEYEISLTYLISLILCPIFAIVSLIAGLFFIISAYRRNKALENNNIL